MNEMERKGVGLCADEYLFKVDCGQGHAGIEPVRFVADRNSFCARLLDAVERVCRQYMSSALFVSLVARHQGGAVESCESPGAVAVFPDLQFGLSKTSYDWLVGQCGGGAIIADDAAAHNNGSVLGQCA